MAFSITCPSCSAKLKTATAIPAGRSVQCPKCNESFAVSSENMVEVTDSKFAAPNPAGKSGAAAAAAKTAAPPPPKKAAAPENAFSGLGESTPKKSRRDDNAEDETPRSRKRRDDDEDEDKRPRKKRQDDEEEDEAPRSRKRRDDVENEDERPRKKHRDEEEEEAAPRSRKRRDDDEDADDRPRKKRRDDEEEEAAPRSRKRRDDKDEDRPSRHRDDDEEDERPRKKKKKKKKGGGLKIGLAAGGLVAVGVIVFLLIWLLGGGYDSEMIALMPSDVHSLEFANIEKIFNHAKLKKLAESRLIGGTDADIFKSAGLSTGDVKSTLEGSARDSQVKVVRLKSSFDKNKMTSGASESKAGDKSYWKLKGGMFVAFPSETLIVLTGKEESMKAILNKESGKIVIPEALKEYVGRVGSGDFWHVELKPGKVRSPSNDEGLNAMSRRKGSASQTDISSDSMSRTEYIYCSSDEDAKKVVGHLSKFRDLVVSKIDEDSNRPGKEKLTQPQVEAVKRSIRDSKYVASGDQVTCSSSLDLASFNDLDRFLGLFFD